MGFIEELRKRNQSEVARERAREQREEDQRTARAQRYQQQEEERLRRDALGRQAIERSAVPGIAHDYASAAQGDLSTTGGGITVGFDRQNLGHDFGSHGDHTKWKYVRIQGREDGSIEIGTGILGRTVLSARDAQNPRQVESALEKAHKHPGRASGIDPHDHHSGQG